MQIIQEVGTAKVLTGHFLVVKQDSYVVDHIWLNIHDVFGKICFCICLILLLFEVTMIYSPLIY